MPSQKKRINLTVDDDMNKLLDDLAELTETPKARLIMNFLREAEPALKTMRKALITAQKSRDKIPFALAELASDANARVAIINAQMADVIQTDWVGDND